jgi:plasmid replication initiation protein
MSLYRLQPDFFHLSVSDVAPKELQDLMTHNWFSLSKRPRYEPIRHQVGKSFIEVTGSAEYGGIANMFDADVLIYLISNLQHAKNTDADLGSGWKFTVYDVYKFLDKKRMNGYGYRHLRESVLRLHHTHVRTNLRSPDQAWDRTISWNWLPFVDIKERVTTDEQTRAASSEYNVSLCQFLFDAVVERSDVLTLPRDYFSLTSPLHRWMYQWVRKSAGRDNWSEKVTSIYNKSASQSPWNRFLYEMRQLANKGSILDYTVRLDDSGRKSVMYFERMSTYVDQGDLTKVRDSRKTKPVESDPRQQDMGLTLSSLTNKYFGEDD